jgi:hypothetical protein
MGAYDMLLKAVQDDRGNDEVVINKIPLCPA